MAAHPAGAPPWKPDRRTVLKAGLLGMSTMTLGRVITACGGSSEARILPAGTSLVQRWVPDQLTPGFVRLPISLANQSGVLPTGPDELTGRIVNYLDGAVVADGLSAQRLSLGEGSPAFWVFTATLDNQGVYELIVDGGPKDGASLQIRDPEFLTVPRVGQPLPPLETPTFDNARGVDVICTRTPEPCPFHEMTLAEALTTATAESKKVVFLVGTPAHCQTGVCAPVLEYVIESSIAFPDVLFVHSDVYLDQGATKVAPTVSALTLTFEPVLWITDPTGTITHRFEGVWHPSEVDAALRT